MPGRVICAYGGTERAPRALRRAREYARALDADLLAISVAVNEEEHDRQAKIFADLAVTDPDVATTLISYREVAGVFQHPATRGLLVIGNHGMQGIDRWTRNVSADIVARLPRTTLVVNTAIEPVPYEDAVVAVPTSPSEVLLTTAVTIASALLIRLTGVHVGTVAPALSDIPVRTAPGLPAEALLEVSRPETLLVLGTRGLRGTAPGGVPGEVLARAAGDVLLVETTETS